MKKIINILAFISIGLLFFAAGIFISYNKYNNEFKNSKQEIKKLKEKIKNLQETIKKQQSFLEKNTLPSEALDYACSIIPKQNKSTTTKKKEKVKLKHKPQLVIIIDDMAFKNEVKLLKSIPLHITPSFFPPTSIHPNTPKYAKEFKHYMIHMPMEAIHFNRSEENTLETNDSYEKILGTLIAVKSLFPNVKFINNHTGSKFTSNKEAMKKLFKALKSLNINFVDSKTTPYSVSKIVDKEFNLTLYERNIFLDNIRNVKYIKKQLKKQLS